MAPALKVGDIAQIKGDKKNCGKMRNWNHSTTYWNQRHSGRGRNQNIRKNNLLERPIQFLIPLELQSETNKNLHQREIKETNQNEDYHQHMDKKRTWTPKTTKKKSNREETQNKEQFQIFESI